MSALGRNGIVCVGLERGAAHYPNDRTPNARAQSNVLTGVVMLKVIYQSSW